MFKVLSSKHISFFEWLTSSKYMNTSSSAINLDEICKLTQVNINMIFFLRWQCISSSFPPAVIYGIQKEITDLAKCLRLRNHCHINIEKYCLHRKIFLFLFFQIYYQVYHTCFLSSMMLNCYPKYWGLAVVHFFFWWVNISLSKGREPFTPQQQ